MGWEFSSMEEAADLLEEGMHGAETHTLRNGASQPMRVFLKRNDGPGSLGVGKNYNWNTSRTCQELPT